MMKELVVWSSDLSTSDEWEQELRKEYPEYADFSDEEMYSLMADMNSNYLEDERSNLDIVLDGNIIIIANLGLWNGRFSGYKEIGDNIKDCLETDCDYATWFIDGRKDLCCKASHHDGTNHYLYRELKANLSDIQIENFKDKIYSGEVKRSDITRYTSSVGKHVLEVYGVA